MIIDQVDGHYDEVDGDAVDHGDKDADEVLRRGKVIILILILIDLDNQKVHLDDLDTIAHGDRDVVKLGAADNKL